MRRFKKFISFIIYEHYQIVEEREKVLVFREILFEATKFHFSLFGHQISIILCPIGNGLEMVYEACSWTRQSRNLRTNQ